MVNTILRAARVSDSNILHHGRFIWRRVELYISRLFEKRSPTSLNRIITLLSPYLDWEGTLNNTIAVSRWASAALATPYTEQVGQNVVDALFQISYMDFLRPHVPIGIWKLLKRRPTLPPVYRGFQKGANKRTVAHVRRFGDVELLKSYFLLVWINKPILYHGCLNEMERSLRQDFSGIGMGGHRKDLLEQLDRVLGQPTSKRDGGEQFRRLRDLLLKVDRRRNHCTRVSRVALSNQRANSR